tara:strand:+ start:593 stop:862 length:270 start_codon:yes stop_codon:yes gene_type:complete
MAHTISLLITDADLYCLNNDLLDDTQWAKDAMRGKIAACKKRMIREWHPKLTADPDVTSIPANEDEIIALIVARPDYKNRSQRDAAEEI